jgi:hypothetical protein
MFVYLTCNKLLTIEELYFFFFQKNLPTMKNTILVGFFQIKVCNLVSCPILKI